MEKLKAVPFYKRFGLRVFLFHAVLLFAIIAPTLILRNMDYKNLMDRVSLQTALFSWCADRLGRLEERDWPAAIEGFPRVFYQQRICVFSVEKELLYDSGIMKELEGKYRFPLLLPDPYLDWAEQNRHFDPSLYIAHLRGINLDRVDPERLYQSTRSVRYPEGLDRILLTGRLLRARGGEARILTLSHSLVDILIHGRSIKERLFIVYALVVLLCLLLTVVLSRSVTGPLRKLYAYSRQILAAKWADGSPYELPRRGEIGEICRALQGLIQEQKKQAESFLRFSSDIVHELKTPLAVIRSGLEVYAESTDPRARERTYERIIRRIGQMESLMDEIRLLGSMEALAVPERCENLRTVIEEVLPEFADAKVRLEMAAGLQNWGAAISCDKLYRILSNLLKNATSFSPQPGSVSAAVGLEDGHLVLQVRDRGPGIAAEVFSQITDRFFTYRPPSGERHSGLGLSIVDAILRGCAGRLEYRNRPEGGAEFTCRIPAFATQPPTEPSPATPPPAGCTCNSTGRGAP